MCRHKGMHKEDAGTYGLPSLPSTTPLGNFLGFWSAATESEAAENPGTDTDAVASRNDASSAILTSPVGKCPSRASKQLSLSLSHAPIGPRTVATKSSKTERWKDEVKRIYRDGQVPRPNHSVHVICQPSVQGLPPCQDTFSYR